MPSIPGGSLRGGIGAGRGLEPGVRPAVGGIGSGDAGGASSQHGGEPAPAGTNAHETNSHTASATAVTGGGLPWGTPSREAPLDVTKRKEKGKEKVEAEINFGC